MKGIWVIVIAVGVAIDIAIIAFLVEQSNSAQPSNNNNLTQFISKNDAIKAIENKFFNGSTITYLRGPETKVSFDYMKYNGTVGHDPSFVLYSANMTTRAVNNSDAYPVIFSGFHSRLYDNSTERRFVWAVRTECHPSCTFIIVDAKQGTVIGTYNPCPNCIWSPYLSKK